MKTTSLLLSALAASSASAFGAYNEPPKAEVTKTDNFTWSDPFHSHRLRKLDVACTAERTFAASEFLLHDLFERDPKGLWSYGDVLKKLFTGQPYPGGWDGLDPHMYERPLLRMAYSDVPLAVREWIEARERSDDDGDNDAPGKHLFAVFERQTDPERQATKTVKPAKTPQMAAMFRPLDQKRVVIFSPGALYDILPLWVADGSPCKSELLDLDRYTPKPKAGAVIAWTTQHSTPNRDKDEREMTFTIKAQTLRATADATENKEEL